MPSAFDEAFDELTAELGSALGTPCIATIGTQQVSCVVLEEPFNPIIAEDGGGVTQEGTQTIMVKKSALTSFSKYPNGEPPINTTPTLVLGVSAYVLSVNNRLGILYIQTGFPADKS